MKGHVMDHPHCSTYRCGRVCLVSVEGSSELVREER